MIASLALLAHLWLADSPRPADAPQGAYLEARTASVFAGACHYGSEYMTVGREAAVAWRIEAGAFGGVSLAGVDVVALIAADGNLAEPRAGRRSVVLVPEGLDAARREAALGWLAREHGALLGRIAEVRSAKLELVLDGDRFDLRAGETLRIAGASLPNRECCKMPYAVWYAPFDAAVSGAVVGEAEAFGWSDPVLERSFETARQNCVFRGRFGVPAEG